MSLIKIKFVFLSVITVKLLMSMDYVPHAMLDMICQLDHASSLLPIPLNHLISDAKPGIGLIINVFNALTGTFLMPTKNVFQSAISAVLMMPLEPVHLASKDLLWIKELVFHHLQLILLMLVAKPGTGIQKNVLLAHQIGYLSIINAFQLVINVLLSIMLTEIASHVIKDMI